MTTKRVTIPTNYNNKLASPRFLHIDLAPARPVGGAELEQTEIEFCTRDGSFPPFRVKLVDTCRLPLFKLHSVATYQSHGMTSEEFIDWFTATYKTSNITTNMCIYYYQKL